ncbi:hypothetical protein D9M72_387790 [compost metagenome]
MEAQFGRQHFLPPHDAEIGAALEHQPADVFHQGEQHFQLDRRETAGERFEQLAQRFFRIQLVNGENQARLDALAQAFGHAAEVLAAFQDHARFRQQPLAGRGQHGVAAGAVEQCVADIDLQVRHGGADH